jgi:hypothetical protein
VLLVLVSWFLVYRPRHEGLENRALLRRMYIDLWETLRRIAEEQRNIGDLRAGAHTVRVIEVDSKGRAGATSGGSGSFKRRLPFQRTCFASEAKWAAVFSAGVREFLVNLV